MTVARWNVYSKIVDAEIVVPQTSKEVLSLTIDELADSLDDAGKSWQNEAVACSAMSCIMLGTLLFVHFHITYIALTLAFSMRCLQCTREVIERFNFKESAIQLQGDYNGPPFTPTTRVYWY